MTGRPNSATAIALPGSIPPESPSRTLQPPPPCPRIRDALTCSPTSKTRSASSSTPSMAAADAADALPGRLRARDPPERAQLSMTAETFPPAVAGCAVVLPSARNGSRSPRSPQGQLRVSSLATGRCLAGSCRRPRRDRPQALAGRAREGCRPRRWSCARSRATCGSRSGS